ncbi:PBECR2 nuclease fold domain-containing protein [Campylobacter devanensis]|uniref:PBECR2 nuclease fold domain-containing protein n=1 Tax=Campylobacter devanensis TaxID=3161138 RepID=UPI000A33F74C|nr:PBECR2 nuclease fold domain-containing protein [Campylobacter sp. P0136]
MAEIYTVRSILGDESLQNLINQGKSQDEIISIAKAYKDEAIKSGDKDALNRMNLVNGKQGRADFFTRLGDKMDANGYETMGSIARGIDILASKAAAPIAGLVGDSDKEAQILADMKLTQSINEAKKLDEIATTPRTQREYQIDSNNLLANAIGSYTKDSKTYARNLVEQAENSGYTAMDRFNIGMATTANATKYFIKSFFYGEDSKQARDIKDAQKILQASRDAYEANNPDKWNVANFAGEMVTDPLNAVGLAKGFKVANTAFKKGANVAFDLAQLGAIGGMAGAISEYGSYKDKDEQNVAGAAMIGAGAGVALGAGFMALGAVLGKIASRFGQKSTLEQNAQMAKDEASKELDKGTPQDIDKRLQKISDDIEEAFSADENAENIARLLGQEYDDNINKAIKESQEVSTAIDDSVAKFANDNPNSSASDIEIYINKTYAPSQSEKELTRIINDDKPVTPRMAGYRVLGVLQKTMEYKTRFDRDTIIKRFKNHGFNDELANIFADAYTADDISVARRYLDSKVASNRQKSVEDGRNEWLENTTKSDKAKTPKNQDEILKEISSDKTQFKLIDDSDMTPELKSRLENDGYTLEREPESGVWEVSKASDKIAKDEVKSDGDWFIASDDNIKDLVKNISLNKDIAMQLQPKADLLNLAKDFSKVIKTPIFDSKISIDKLLNHLADKNSDKRLEYLNLIKPTLENPLFITKENNRYRFVKTFIDSDKITKFLSVIENDNGEFIGITATPIKNTDLKNLLKGDIVWGGDTLSTLNAPQIAKQEVEAMSETIPNQDLKSADVAELTFQDKKGKDHIITKEIQKEWIDTFGLKNLDDTYIPKFNNEIKKALGNKELKLQKGSLLKLVSQGRQKFIPEIKKVLDDPEIIITDKNGEIILAKHLKDKDYFVNVSFDNGEYLISISNGIKEINNLNNKIKQGGRILYQSPNANSISQTLLQTSQYSANKIDVAPVSTPKNDLDRTLSNRYDSSNSTPKEIKSQEPNLSRAERRAMGIEEPKGKTLVIDEKAVKSDVREFGRLAHQVGLGFKSAKEAKAVMDKCDKSKFDCGS